MTGGDSDQYRLSHNKERKPQKAKCPGCGTPIEPGSVLCIECGYNFRTGSRLKTTHNIDDDDDESLVPEGKTEDERHVRLRTEWNRSDYLRYWARYAGQWFVVIAVVWGVYYGVSLLFRGPCVTDANLSRLTPGMELEEARNILCLGVTLAPNLQADGLDRRLWVLERGEPGIQPDVNLNRRELILLTLEDRLAAPPLIVKTDAAGQSSQQWHYTPAWKAYFEGLSAAERNRHGQFGRGLFESVPLFEESANAAE